MSEYMDKALELLEETTMENIVNYMDDEIREAVHADMAPCSDPEFLAEYMARHFETYGEDFTI